MIKDGQIAEDGSHEELIAQKGEYAYMYEAQSAWYKDEMNMEQLGERRG